MVWYRDLYVGRLIAFRCRKVVEGIEAGKYPAGVYVVILPESSSSQLEIMSAGELRHPWIRTHCRMIVAIAQGKMEAQGLVERIAGDVYLGGDSADIRSWLIERQKASE